MSKGFDMWAERLGRMGRWALSGASAAGLGWGLASQEAQAGTAGVLLKDLAPEDGVAISGLTNTFALGYSLARVGDMNGDGVSDFAVGTPAPFFGDPSGAGTVFVVFGGSHVAAPFDLSSLNGTSTGFRFFGTTNDAAGRQLAGGDFNGDGLGDLAVSATGGVGEDTSTTDGRIYLIYGRTNGYPAALGANSVNWGAEGAILLAPTNFSDFGQFAEGVGDVNGDGADDLAIGEPSYDGIFMSQGRALVVFGGAFGATNLVSTLDGTDGFVFQGSAEDEGVGFGLGSAGDLNGDGVGDMYVGAPQFQSGPSSVPVGRGFVVFGSTNGFAPELRSFELTGANGFGVRGTVDFVLPQPVLFGWTGASAGDFNNDGRDDLLVNAVGASAAYGGFNGRAYVLLGRPEPYPLGFDLEAMPNDEVAIFEGANPGDVIGYGFGGTLEGVGDFNADGFDDFVVGSAGLFGGNVGKAHVVFGSEDPFVNPFSLLALDGQNGKTYIGETNADFTGFNVEGPGDVNADGGQDLIITAMYGGATVGKCYVIFGEVPSGTTGGGATGGGTGGTTAAGTTGGTSTGTAGTSTAGTTTGGGTTAAGGTGGVTGAGTGGSTGGATGGGTNQVELLDWEIVLKRPKSSKPVKFTAGKKGVGTVKGTVSEIELDAKTEGVQVQLALVVEPSGTNSNSAATITFEDVDKVSKVNKKGVVKFNAKKFAADADLESGDEFAIVVRATEPDADFNAKTTPTLTNEFEVK